ncbi:MAG: Inner membrane transport permease YadH [Alphaproteobacteria bacterium MarineAlpha6_Bin4]|nr:MAG: Inner membrane transport permease YadH [Alphaproteobacteria bacterium MarineAlpha6_Bin3]PPR37505.1 MAG: Inner membrane transport permease YadH [Alphaproteobacteria bacterium MarineAlpha6_Bin4]|tara:strand:- start:13709 stop:14503 length:795 start_codon:yes stop_codon:yes gene_type:complete
MLNNKNFNASTTNWIGLWTLFSKETSRFLKVFYQTVLAPVVTNILFLTVFLIVIDRDNFLIGGVEYAEFLVPGLIMMQILQNAFMNTTSSIMISKVQGNIVDLLLPPLSSLELTIALSLGGVARGMIVGLASTIALYFFVDMKFLNFFYIIFFSFSGSLALSLLGIMGGIWSEKFDHMAGLTAFIITPLTFLSGSFYSIEKLPEFLGFLAKYNPIFYFIDGFRAGYIGYSDAPIINGFIVCIVLNTILFISVYKMFQSGYKLRT